MVFFFFKLLIHSLLLIYFYDRTISWFLKKTNKQKPYLFKAEYSFIMLILLPTFVLGFGLGNYLKMTVVCGFLFLWDTFVKLS